MIIDIAELQEMMSSILCSIRARKGSSFAIDKTDYWSVGSADVLRIAECVDNGPECGIAQGDFQLARLREGRRDGCLGDSSADLARLGGLMILIAANIRD